MPRPVFLDLSPHQQPRGHAPPDFEAMKAAGVAGVILRIFEGQTPDEVEGGYSFETLRRAALAAGLVVGSYQYFRARHPGDWQAGLYLKALGDLGPRELPPALDVEELDGQSPEKARQEVLAWIYKVREITGQHPIIYTGPIFWLHTLKAGNLPGVSDCPLWIADYRVPGPQIPAPWKETLLYQFTGSGKSAGVAGPVDINAWTGPELEAWLGKRCGV